MPQSEKIKQLDEQIRSTVERAIRNLRSELSERLDAQQQRLREALDEVSVELPERLVSEDDLESLAEPPPAAEPAWDDLAAAIDAIDRARSQKEILRALVQGASHFASRAAVFLIRSGQVRGWENAGFEGAEAEAIGGVAFEVPERGPWKRLIDEEGALVLDQGECGDIAQRLETSVSQEAVLVPLFLRDRVAAALYADRTGDEALPVTPLQTLTYVSALALESLPLRERTATPTLHLRGDGTSPPEPSGEARGAPAGPVTSGTEAVAPSLEPPSEPAPPSEAEPPGPPETAVPPPPSLTEDDSAEPAEEGTAPQAGLGDVEEVELEPPESESWTLDEGPAEPAPPPAPPAAEPELTVGEESSLPPQVAGEPGPAGPSTETGSSVGEPPVSEPPVGEPPTSEPSSSVAGVSPEPSGEEESPQVEPPSDLEGPGWAFNPPAAGEEMDSEEEARHEEAKRLARLLVSEIKLYNEEAVQEGRKSQDVVERLKEDIDRSRELYEQRVDEQVRERTDYFYQEMVRLLGGGDPKALGI